MRYGPAAFLVPSVLCAALAGVAGGFPLLSIVFVGLSVTGLAHGVSVLKSQPPDKAVLTGTLAPVLVAAPLAGLYFLAAGVDPWALLSQTLERGIRESAGLYRQMGMPEQDINALMPTLRIIARVVQDYFPAMAVALTSLVSFTSYVLLRRHIAREEGGEAEPLSRWHAPDHAVWGVIVPGFLVLIPNPVVRQMAGNLAAVFAIVFFFQGLALTTYFFERMRLSPVLKGLGYLIVALQPFLIGVMLLLGFFDTWTDLRKVRPKK